MIEKSFEQGLTDIQQMANGEKAFQEGVNAEALKREGACSFKVVGSIYLESRVNIRDQWRCKDKTWHLGPFPKSLKSQAHNPPFCVLLQTTRLFVEQGNTMFRVLVVCNGILET